MVTGSKQRILVPGSSSKVPLYVALRETWNYHSLKLLLATCMNQTALVEHLAGGLPAALSGVSYNMGNAGFHSPYSPNVFLVFL